MQYHNYLAATFPEKKETHITTHSDSDHDESICDSLKIEERKTSGRVNEFRSFSVLQQGKFDLHRSKAISPGRKM